MEIRAATEEYIPGIVRLLKQTLGETLLQKSEEYWRWKHVNNPFGRSPVLLAMEGEEIVGVRAFMRWEWLGEKKVYRAVRAVDTATHMDHQGKGIFRKLTLALVDSCKQDGDDFVFNTPNQQSKPGYIKMGWQEGGKVPIQLSLHRPVSILANLLKNKRTTMVQNSMIGYYLNHPDLPSLLSHHQLHAKNIITNVSQSYLKWRYLDVPVARYVAIGEERNNELKGLVIARIKDGRIGRELRVTDVFLRDTRVADMIKQFKDCKKQWKIDFCTFSGTLAESNKLLLGPLKLKFRFGPVVTVRDLSLVDLEFLKNFDKWSPSLGDLELF